MTYNKKLWIYRIAYSVFAFIIPVIVVGYYYGFFKQVPAKTKLTGIGLVLVIILSIKYIKWLIKAVNDMKNKRFRALLIGAFGLGITIGLVLLLECGRDKIDVLKNTVLLCGISITISIIVNGEIGTLKQLIQKENDYKDFATNMDRYKNASH